MMIYLTSEEEKILSAAISQYIVTLDKNNIDSKIDIFNLKALKQAFDRGIGRLYLSTSDLYQIHIPNALNLYFKKMGTKESKKLLLRYKNENDKWRSYYVKEIDL